ncbi:hypothetical protein [Cryobacterium soli]|uniref:hypothetical protein n=1 Tax=Cryobacterium soli TaxID=2220095 RepID=UPI0013C414CD|nr:hypothetical protein [Cryobacterium soli]
MSDQSGDSTSPTGREAATRLLQNGDAVSLRVRNAIDDRTRAIAEAWLGVGVLAYAVCLVFASKGEDGTGMVPGVQAASPVGLGAILTLLIPFFVASSLERGLQQSLHTTAAAKPGRRRSVVTAASLVPLLFITGLVVFAPATPWPIALVVAFSASLPLGVLSVRSALRARASGVRRPAPTLVAPLSPANQVSMTVLGLWLGAAVACGGLPFPAVGAIIVIGLLFAIGVLDVTRWGLPQLAQEWGRTQWIAFGFSYLTAIIVAVLLARSAWDPSIVSSVGGILVAVPLVVTAFRPAPIWADR